MITIAFATGQLGIGGGEKQLYLILKYLDRKKFKPVVISFNPGAEDFWEKPIGDLDIKIFFVPKSRFLIKRFVNFFQIVKSVHPRVIQSWSAHYNFPVSIAGLLLRIPFRIGSIRQNLFRQGVQPRSSSDRYKAIMGLDYIITNSSRGMEDLIKMGVKKNRIQLFYNGIESFQERNGGFEREKIRAQWKISADEIIIGSIGTLHWVKNYQFMLRLFEVLCKKYDYLWLIIFGDGPERLNLENMSKDLKISDRVKFLGGDIDASKKLQAFDIFCFTSISEGMPNALVEASAAGLPIVTSNIGGADDIVVHNKTGFICEEHDIKSYCNYISSLIDNYQMRKDFGVAANKNTVEKFDIAKLSYVHNDFYGKFLTLVNRLSL